MFHTESEPSPVRASYLPFLEDNVHEPSPGTDAGAERGRRRSREGSSADTRAADTRGFTLPRRREARESLRVQLVPEQLYWLRLAAARAGRKVDESTIVAAGLALLERLDIDWRRIGSRADLAQVLARTARAGASWPATSKPTGI